MFPLCIDGATLTTISGMLKRFYPEGKVVDTLYNKLPLLKLLKKETTTVKNTGAGLTAYVPIQILRNQSVGSVSEGSALTTPRNNSYLQLEIGLAYTYGSIQFTGQTLEASSSNATSFAKVAEQEMDNLIKSMKLHVERMYMTGNGSGMLAMTNGAGAGASSTVTVDAPGTQWLFKGMPIVTTSAETGADPVADEDISEGLTESTSYTVFKIDSATTFTLGNAACSAAVTTEKWHDNHYIFRYGSVNGAGTTFSSTDKESMGLRGIADNYAIRATSSWFGLGTAKQTIHGLDRNTYGDLDAIISYNTTAPNTTRVWDEGTIIDHLNSIDDESGNDSDVGNMIFVSDHAVARKYFELLSPDRRYMDPVNFKGGFKSLAFYYSNTFIPWMETKFAVPNTLFTIDLRHVKIYQSKDMKWLDYNGNIFEKKVDSSGHYDSYIGWMGNYSGLGCDGFKTLGAIRDLSTT